MKKMPAILAVAAAALTLASCNKEQELAAPSASQSSSAASTLAKPDLLVAGSWHQTGFTVSAPVEGSNQIATSDMFAVSKPSMLVRMAAFKADGTFSQLRGARPGQAIAETTTGTWRLTAAADSLIITEPKNTRHLAVAELSANTLRLTFTQASEGGKATTYTTVFAH